MISSIEFSNYRIFSSTQKFKLAPITIIFGKNNAGKSALLKLPLLIQSALANHTDEIFTKSVNGVRLCDEYRDVVFGKANKAVSIELKSTEKDTLKFSFFIDALAKGKQSFIEEWTLISANGETLHLSKKENEFLQDDSGNSFLFNGIVPQLNEQYDWVNNCLKHFQTKIDYLGPIRQIPIKDFRLQDDPPSFVGSKGEYAYDYLIRDLESDGPLLNKVSSWYEKVFDGNRLQIDRSHAPVYYIEMQNKSIKNNILDTGAGIAQSIPVIISIAKDSKDTPVLHIFEEPETHLHPAAHAELSDFIASEIKKDKNKQAIIETHSLNFILRLRLLVAEGKINPSDIALYFVEYDQEQNSSCLKEVSVSRNGDVSLWPTNVFNESLEEVLKIRNVQQKL